MLPLAVRGPRRLRGMRQARWVRPRWTRAGTACTGGTDTQVGTGGTDAQVGTGGHRHAGGHRGPQAGKRREGLPAPGDRCPWVKAAHLWPKSGPCAVQTPNPGHLEGKTKRGALPVPSSGPEGSQGQNSSLRPTPEASWEAAAVEDGCEGQGWPDPHRRSGSIPGACEGQGLDTDQHSTPRPGGPAPPPPLPLSLHRGLRKHLLKNEGARDREKEEGTQVGPAQEPWVFPQEVLPPPRVQGLLRL